MTIGLFATSKRLRRYRKQRSSHLQERYGITVSQYQEMLREQAGGCAICGKVQEGHLRVDHSHATNRVRGLLCTTCNVGLGSFQDNPDLLRRAITYLETRGG